MDFLHLFNDLPQHQSQTCCLPIARMTVQEAGLSDAVLDLLGQCFSKKPSDVKVHESKTPLFCFFFKSDRCGCCLQLHAIC